MNAENKKQKAADWFQELQGQICTAFEEIEDELIGGSFTGAEAGRFERSPWDRENNGQPNDSGSILQGGGEMSVMRGRVFEKVGVNFSQVHGTFSDDFAKQIPGADESNGDFWAAGVSLVAHMRSPLVPAVHMNTRMIVTSKSWFGGGTDLTPMIPDQSDTDFFHAGLKDCCDRHAGIDHQEYKEWCDRYFYLPHRKEPRGIGGIFFDYLENDWNADFNFVKDVGVSFKDIYCDLVRKHMNREWTAEQRETQLIKRGRYVEFNLLHDRGTTFGLKTGGNTEAILMSMPPEVKWP